MVIYAYLKMTNKVLIFETNFSLSTDCASINAEMSRDQLFNIAKLDKRNSFKGSGTGNYYCFCKDQS